MSQVDVYKRLMAFQGLRANETKVFAVFGDNDVQPLASRLGDLGPWQAVTNHSLEEITDPIVEELVQSTMISSAECKQLLEKPITDALVKAVKPVISQIVEDAKSILRDLESYPVVKIHTEEKTKQIETLLLGRIQPLLRAPIMEYLPQEEELLKKLNQLLEFDYPRLFDITKKYVAILLNLMKHYDGDKTARTAIGEEKLKEFKQNLILFRDGVTFKQVRTLRPEPNPDQVNTAMFAQAFADVDQMIGRLNG